MDNLPPSGEKANPQTRKWRDMLWSRVLFGALRGFFADRALALAASLAFYTMLSFAPLLVLVVWVSTMVGYDARQMMLDQVASTVGPSARTTVAAMYDSARQHPSLGSITGIASIVIALISATTVFAQLQASLNGIWHIRARPGHALSVWLRQRVLSLGVIAAVGLVLIVSLVANAALGVVLPHSGALWDVLNDIVTGAIMTVLFAAVFQYLPDARLPWRRVLWGGLITAVLFTIGNWAIGLYLSSGRVGGAYGAASALTVLLVWVYYSGAIFFLGAEVVHAWAHECGEGSQLQPHAESIE